MPQTYPKIRTNNITLQKWKSITKKDTITPFMYYFQMQLVIHSPFYQSEVLGRMGRVDSCSEDSVLKSMSLSSMIGGTSLIEPLYTETNFCIQKLTFGNQSKNIQIIALWASPTTSVSFKVKKTPFSIFPVNLSLVKALTRWANLLKDVFLEGQCPFSQIYSALWTIWFRLHIIIICKIIQIIRREVGLCVLRKTYLNKVKPEDLP